MNMPDYSHEETLLHSSQIFQRSYIFLRCRHLDIKYNAECLPRDKKIVAGSLGYEHKEAWRKTSQYVLRNFSQPVYKFSVSHYRFLYSLVRFVVVVSSSRCKTPSPEI